MAEELLLSPEITMHEEPGHITINQDEVVSVEIDDDETLASLTGVDNFPGTQHQPQFPFANGEIPPEISITKVNANQRPTLKVRNDLLTSTPPPIPGASRFPPNVRPMQSRPPPLVRRGSALPPMPKLKLGVGPRVMPRNQSPLSRMINMQNHMFPQQNVPPRIPTMANVRPPMPMRQMPNPPNGVHNNFRNEGYRQNRPTVINVSANSPFTNASIAKPRMPMGGPPPMIRPGYGKPRFSSPQPPNPHQPNNPIRSVFVPPPMRMNQRPGNAQQMTNQMRMTMMAKNNGHSRVEDEEIDDDEEEETYLDEELDDVEPDVDPNTNEVDDVEPMPDEQAELIRKIDKHQVTVSITAKSGNNPVAKPPEEAKEPVKVQYVRKADGKGFVKKIVNQQTMNRIRAKKKKKRRPFRGISYKFDGSRMKRRVGPKKVNGDAAEKVSKDDTVLNYLGIQRKDSSDSKAETMSLVDSLDSDAITIRPLGPKAKKSFKHEAVDSRSNSFNDASSTDSLPGSGSKRRLSLSEVLHSQKKMKPDLLQVGMIRNSLGNHQQPSFKNTNGSVENLSDFSDVKNGDEGSEIINKSLPRLRQRAPRNDIDSNPPQPLQPCVCLCESSEETGVKPGDTMKSEMICEAVESVGGNKVGCKNKVDNDKFRFRATKRLQRIRLCQVHVQRLKGHHVCGFCGEFCAHGLFFMCRPTKKSPPHFFHKQCFLNEAKDMKKCPHCDSREQPLVVQLKLNMTKVPLTLLQVASKMTFPPKNTTKKSDLLLGRRADVLMYKMKNGKIISSEGLPQGIENESLEKVLKALEDKQTLKHATRNMHVPVKSGDNVKVMQLLSLGYSANTRFAEADNGTPLHIAAAEGHVLTAHILVQAGAELDPLDDEQNTPLMLACVKGKHDIVKYLLQAGADLTLRGDDGMTCLHLATQSGFLECAHAILGQSNLPRNFLNNQDEGGWTPLVWACENKHEEVIMYLLERGADPLITDAEGNIALHWAALSGSRSTCELLINAGCDVNATNNIGETPIHISLRQDHYECTVLLLIRGARLDIRNKHKLTPAECMVSRDVTCRTVVRLSTSLHQMMRDAKTSRAERIVCNDITRAKESNPIQCVNNYDDEREPSDYIYVNKNCVTSMVPIDRNISKLQHCKCTDTCSSEDSCHCSDLSVKSWYDVRGCLKEGFDYKEPPMIFECNEMCKCNVSICHNRVIQHGITARLQVFRTNGMGWGVRPITDIPKGSFVCEYIGEIISDSEADTREDSYLFDLDNRDGETFCIDANKYGNIARFINHSCSPNLVPVKVFASHQDLRFPHIALFASRDIPRGEELGFDYGEKFWVIKHRYFTCHCASDKCRYNRSSIYSFLKEYYKRIGEPMPEDIKPLSNVVKPSKDSVFSEGTMASKSSSVVENNAANSATPKMSSNEVKKDIKSETPAAGAKESSKEATTEEGPKTEEPDKKDPTEHVTPSEQSSQTEVKQKRISGRTRRGGSHKKEETN